MTPVRNNGRMTTKFKYAICNELYESWPVEKSIDHMAALGYTGVEVAPFTLGENASTITSAVRDDYRKRVEAAGMEIIGLHWLLAKTEGFHLTHPDADVRKRTADYMIELAKLCSDLGGSLMVLGSPQQRNLETGVTKSEAMLHALEVIRGAVPTMENLGVTLALEPLGPEETNFMLTAEEGIELAAAVDSPNVKLHLDVKAMSTEGKPFDQIIADSQDWTAHFHANDPNRQGPGMGDVNFDPIFRSLIDSNYQGWVSVEVFDYDPGIETLAGQSIRYMREIESQIG